MEKRKQKERKEECWKNQYVKLLQAESNPTTKGTDL